MVKNIIGHSVNNIEDSIRGLRGQQKMLRDHKALINHRLTPLLRARAKGWLRWDPSVHANYYGGNFEIYAHMKDVEGFKDPELALILEAYIDATKIKSEDHASAMTRDYKFTFGVDDGITPVVTVHLSVQVKSDSPTCQKILKEVKETVQREEVYELVCSDGTTGA